MGHCCFLQVADAVIYSCYHITLYKRFLIFLRRYVRKFRGSAAVVVGRLVAIVGLAQHFQDFGRRFLDDES